MTTRNLNDDEIWETLKNIKYKIHPSYGSSYLEYDQQLVFEECISLLRKNGNTDYEEIAVLQCILKSAKKSKIELQNWLYNEPRREAQKFLSKKNIREFIFKRDGFKCLRCGSLDKLSLDHIVPVIKGGVNRIGNLQTLCSSCNSWKSDKYIDYR